MSYRVRLMRKEDLAEVNEIDREAFPSQWPPPNYQRELQNPLAHYIAACDESKIAEEPEVKAPEKKGIVGLASRIKRWLNHDIGNKLPPSGRRYILGFAGIWIMADEAHLTNIAVRNIHQHQGIGELLLISITDLVTELKANIITLEVRASNTTAQSLYSKYGFAKAGVRRGYYTDNNEDGIVMTTESITSALFQAQLQQLKEEHSRRYGTTLYQTARNYPVQPGKR